MHPLCSRGNSSIRAFSPTAAQSGRTSLTSQPAHTLSSTNQAINPHLRTAQLNVHTALPVPSNQHNIIPHRLLLPTRTQRPVEPPNPIHILPVLRLLLLAHRIPPIPRHLSILRALEARDPHYSLHIRFLVVGVRLSVGIWFQAVRGRLRLRLSVVVCAWASWGGLRVRVLSFYRCCAVGRSWWW